MMIDCILHQVKKTNPDITKEKLIKELKKSSYATASILIAFSNKKEN